MPDTVTCPVCGETAECAAQIEAIGICSACGATLTIENGIAKRATGADTVALDPGVLQALRKARGRIVRPERRQH